MTDIKKHPYACMCQSCVMQRRARHAARTATAESEAAGAGVRPSVAVGAVGYPTAGVGVYPPPLGNTGETTSTPMSETVELVTADGKIKEVTRRIPAVNECAVIDTLRFTIHQDTFVKTSLIESDYLPSAFLNADDELSKLALSDLQNRTHSPLSDSFRDGLRRGCTLISDEDFVRESSRIFFEIFGFGVSRATGKGRDFYRDAYVLGENFGFVCIGNAGKNDQCGTMLVELNGQGCINALSGWESRLLKFLQTHAQRPQITRIDLAHDDMDGSRVSPDWAEAQWLAGGFTKCVGKAPNIECAGNWHSPTGAGRTLYVGSRKYSSLYFRCYEKGKEQGDPTSSWNRAEVEIKNSDRVIPLDILVRPSDYFIAAYPALAFLSAFRTPQRIAVKKQKAKITVFETLEIVHHQFGKHLRVLYELYDRDADKVLQKVMNDDPKAWPKRLLEVAAGAHTFDGYYLHEIPLMVWDIDSGRYVPAVSDLPANAG